MSNYNVCKVLKDTKIIYCHDNNCEQLKINNKNYICNWNLLQQVPIWACYSITNANTAFLILSRLGITTVLTMTTLLSVPGTPCQKCLCNCHGLVHSCLLCFRLLSALIEFAAVNYFTNLQTQKAKRKAQIAASPPVTIAKATEPWKLRLFW